MKDFAASLIALNVLLFVSPAYGESGYQTIQGTRVFTVIDHGRGVATFSNECGRQTLTQRQLQQGAIPDRIIPCRGRGGSRGLTCQPGFTLTYDRKCIPNGSVYCGNGNVCNGGTICADGGCLKITSSRVCSDLKRYCGEGYECRAGNRCVSPDAEKAQAYWDDAHQSFEDKRFEDAESQFRKAMHYFMDAKQYERAEIVRKRMVEAKCMQRAEKIRDNVAGLKSLAKESECSDVMAAIMVMALDLQIAEEERAKQSRSPVKNVESVTPASAPPNPPKALPTAAAAAPADSCSDVSGTGAPPIQCSGKTVQAGQYGIRCPTGDCLKTAGWTRERPYNQGHTPLKFEQFSGPAIIIPPGYSLWSVADPSTSSRRTLVARPWSGSAMSSAKCAQEYTTATNRDFEVNLECETQRQATLQSEFERREGSLPYMNYSACKGKGHVLQINHGWQARSLDYWKAHPGEPVATCYIVAEGGRSDTHKLREPNWLPENECGRIWPIDISTSPRGVRGCKEDEEMKHR